MSRRELLKGSTDTLLLALLAEGPKYGYQIAREMARRTGGYFRFREGTLYPALHRLEREGLVESRWQEGPGGQMRRYYFITPAGEEALARLQREWREFAQAVNRVIQPDSA